MVGGILLLLLGLFGLHWYRTAHPITPKPTDMKWWEFLLSVITLVGTLFAISKCLGAMEGFLNHSETTAVAIYAVVFSVILMALVPFVLLYGIFYYLRKK